MGPDFLSLSRIIHSGSAGPACNQIEESDLKKNVGIIAFNYFENLDPSRQSEVLKWGERLLQGTGVSKDTEIYEIFKDNVCLLLQSLEMEQNFFIQDSPERTNPLNLCPFFKSPSPFGSPPKQLQEINQSCFSPVELGTRLFIQRCAHFQLPYPRTILVVGNVCPDGFGDFSIFIQIWHILRKHLPNCDLLGLVDNYHNPDSEKLLQSMLEEYKITGVTFVSNFHNTSDQIAKAYRDPTVQQEADKLQRKREEALQDFLKKSFDIMVKTSVDGPIFSLLQGPAPRKDIVFLEYDQDDAPEDPTYTTGLGKKAIGIFIPPIPNLTAFNDPELEKIFATPPPYFAYLENLLQYIQHLLKFTNEDLSIVCNKEVDLDCRRVLGFLKKSGFGSIECVSKTERRQLIINPSNTRKLRLFHQVFPMSHSDMMRCMQLCKEPIGVTGNCSFSEFISVNGEAKLFYYDARHECLGMFLKNLTSLSNDRQKNKFANYLLTLNTTQLSTYSPEVLQTIRKEWEDMVAYLKTEKNAETSIVGLTKLAIFRLDPHFCWLEQRMKDLISTNRITPQEAVFEISKAIQPEAPVKNLS